VDPFASLTPPDNATPRTYACSSASSYTANTSTLTTIVDKVYTSSSANGPWTLSQTNSVSSATTTGSEFGTATTKKNDVLQNTTSTATGAVVTVPGSAAVPASGCNKSGNNCTTPAKPAVAGSYKRTDRITTVTKTVTSVSSTSTPTIAAMQPGTYSDFTMSCDTTMAPGVYVINGGAFKINAQNSIKSLNVNGTSAGVMIVLKNGASLDVNGGSNMNLRAMNTTEMIAAGISESEALNLKDMLIFEDRNSSGAGASGDKLNGNAGAILEGTIYLPKSSITFNGTFGVVSRCLVITAKTITIGGTANMSSFCPAGTADGSGGVSVGGGAASVRLVA
jgi:hypothetical protein